MQLYNEMHYLPKYIDIFYLGHILDKVNSFFLEKPFSFTFFFIFVEMQIWVFLPRRQRETLILRLPLGFTCSIYISIYSLQTNFCQFGGRTVSLRELSDGNAIIAKIPSCPTHEHDVALLRMIVLIIIL